MSGSYAGRMAPPGIPKMCSVPAASSDLIKLWAPVIVAPACWVITVSFVCVRGGAGVSGKRKTPRPTTARGDAWTEAGLSPRVRVRTRRVVRMRPRSPVAPDAVKAVCQASQIVAQRVPLRREVPRLVSRGRGPWSHRPCCPGRRPARRSAGRLLVADQDPAGREGCCDAGLRHLGRHAHVEVEPLARARRAASVRWNHSAGSDPGRVVDAPCSDSGLSNIAEHRRQNGLISSKSQVSRATSTTETAVGSAPTPSSARRPTDRPGQGQVARGDPEDVVAEQRDVDVGVAQVDVGVVVGGSASAPIRLTSASPVAKSPVRKRVRSASNSWRQSVSPGGLDLGEGQRRRMSWHHLAPPPGRNRGRSAPPSGPDPQTASPTGLTETMRGPRQAAGLSSWPDQSRPARTSRTWAMPRSSSSYDVESGESPIRRPPGSR